MAQRETATSAPEIYLLDMFEVISGDVSPRRQITRRGNFSGPSVWDFTSGAVFPARRNGILYRRYAPAANLGAFDNWGTCDHPMGTSPSQDPAGMARPVRYTVGQVMVRDNPIPLDTFAFSVSQIATPLINTTEAGYEISGLTTNWTILARRVSGGGFTVNIDTGIPVTTEVYAEIVYNFTAQPAVWAQVNGVEVPGSRLTGLANLPVNVVVAGAQTSWNVLTASGANFSGHGGGALDFARGFRCTIIELAGYLTPS